VIVRQLPSCDNTHPNGFPAADCYATSYPPHSAGSSIQDRLDDRGGCRVPVYTVEGTQPSPARVRRRQVLPGHEFRCRTSKGIFQLRTLWVVTLCSQRPAIALLGRGGRPTMRYDATGPPLRAETLLAALFEASSPIHEDRNGLPQLTERMEVSRLPPSYRRSKLVTFIAFSPKIMPV
jgi:hypothetical protein